MRERSITQSLLVLPLLCVAQMSGCTPSRVIVAEIERTDEGLVIPGPFAPERMRVHPLTHTEVFEGDRRIIVHLELTDGWGDTVKGLGVVRLSLEPGRVADAGRFETGETAWDIDLREIEDAMEYFDPVTRTYRFVLTGLPAWFGADTRGRLRAQFLTARRDRERTVFRDVFELIGPGSDLGSEGS